MACDRGCRHRSAAARHRLRRQLLSRFLHRSVRRHRAGRARLYRIVRSRHVSCLRWYRCCDTRLSRRGAGGRFRSVSHGARGRSREAVRARRSGAFDCGHQYFARTRGRDRHGHDSARRTRDGTASTHAGARLDAQGFRAYHRQEPPARRQQSARRDPAGDQRRRDPRRARSGVAADPSDVRECRGGWRGGGNRLHPPLRNA